MGARDACFLNEVTKELAYLGRATGDVHNLRPMLLNPIADALGHFLVDHFFPPWSGINMAMSTRLIAFAAHVDLKGLQARPPKKKLMFCKFLGKAMHGFLVNSKTCGPAPQNSQKLTIIHNIDSKRLAQLQQMAIPCDNAFCGPGQRTSNELIVLRIRTHRLGKTDGSHNCCSRVEPVEPRLGILWEVQLNFQFPRSLCKLSKYFFGNYDFKLAVRKSSQAFTRPTAPENRGDKNIGINDGLELLSRAPELAQSWTPLVCGCSMSAAIRIHQPIR